jgi:hypothetical protein
MESGLNLPSDLFAIGTGFHALQRLHRVFAEEVCPRR